MISGQSAEIPKVPLPHISGSDAAGRVVEVGENVASIKVGDKVVSHANLSCRVCELCTSGREFDCPKRAIWGFETGPLWGGFSQYVHLPEVNVVPVPEGVTCEQAAAVSMAGLTAWHMLVGRAAIHPGQTILIVAGGSGIGSIGIQIAKLYECTVIATAGSPEKIARCIDLGADYAVNHYEPEWYKQVRSFTKKQGVDVVFEHIGKTVFSQALSLLKMGATLVSSGATAGYDATIDLRYLFFKGTNLLGATQGTRAELERVLYWTAAKKISPVIDTVIPFSNMVEGHVRMAEHKLFGKLLTSPQKL